MATPGHVARDKLTYQPPTVEEKAEQMENSFFLFLYNFCIKI